ncbi:MAG: hypothetical protein ACPG43_07285 [Alcanivoracaceae bacterium]
MRIYSLALAVLCCLPVCANAGGGVVAPASTVVMAEDGARLSSQRPARLSLIRLPANRGGVLKVSGHISVSGQANLVLWARVEGADYFSRLPALQGLTDVSAEPFVIPFNADTHTVSDLFLEVELLTPGEVTLSDVALLP